MPASPVPWFHPGPCRNTELRSSAQTNAAASFSWCYAVSSASLPSEPSPDPEESRAWRPELTRRAPCSWTALHRHTNTHTRRDKGGDFGINSISMRGRQREQEMQSYLKTEDTCYFVFFLLCCFAFILYIHPEPILNHYSQKSLLGVDKPAGLTVHPDFLLSQSSEARPPFCRKDVLL